MEMSFRAMRRKDRQLERSEAEACLAGGSFGVLATVDESGRPCAVPVSYVVLNGAVYFHSAKEGEKVDNIRREERVCFCVTGENEPLYNGDFTVRYESAVAHGRARLVPDGQEKMDALTVLCEKYFPDRRDEIAASLPSGSGHTLVYRIDIDQLTGKANRQTAAAE